MSDEYKLLITWVIGSFLPLFFLWKSLSWGGIFAVVLTVLMLVFVVGIGTLRSSNRFINSVAIVVLIPSFYATILLSIAAILFVLVTLWKSFSWGWILVLLLILGVPLVVYAATKPMTNKALLRLINKTAFKKKKTLTICHCKLKRLPHQIGQLTSLISLDIRRNNLRVLPSEIWQLTHLQYFDISRNRLMNLPSEIGQLTNISCLNISRNQLTNLPSEIGELINISYLNINRNQLTNLPSEIGNLTNISHLSISRNQLTSLPSEIGNLTNISHLNISENQLTSLPSEIGNLTNILYLNISGNPLTSLPSEIGQLTHLRFLYISHNEATSLPLEIQQMTKLELYVNGVMLTKKYKKCHPSRWSTEWLLSERNAELRRLLIQVIGYKRICQELQVTQLDAWREYTLLKIDARVDVEKICLLKMTCPSTGYIYVVRVPPNIESAREAIKWVNLGIDPEEFSVQT